MANLKIEGWYTSLRALRITGRPGRPGDRQPEKIHHSEDCFREFFEQASQDGFSGVMTLGNSAVVGGLKKYRESNPDFQIFPVIPNVLDYVREATEYGLAGAGIRRLLRVGPLGFVRAGWLAATHPLHVLKKQFPTLLNILCELEMGEFQTFRPPAVFLNQQMTDLALSMENPAVLINFATRCRESFGTEPGLLTANLVRLVDFLDKHQIPVELISAPYNREQFLMPGDAGLYDEIIRGGKFQILVERISVELPTPQDAIDWAAGRQGIHAFVADYAPAMPPLQMEASAAGIE